MKIFKTAALAALMLVLVNANAQTEAPKGSKKGSVLLADGNTQTGFIKDNMRSNASVTFTANNSKKNFTAAELNGLEIEGTKFLSLKGDFFKVISEGELDFLQKASDASGKPSYNGSEAIFSSGTEGKVNDYFIHNNTTGDLTWVSKKNINQVAETSFAGNTAAVDKAKSVNGDVAQLKEAVDIYNAAKK